MLRRLVLPALLVLAACSGSDQTGPQPLSMNGTWRQSGDLRDPVNGDRHINLGNFQFSQAGDDFGGTGSQGIDAFCTTAASARYTGPLADPVLYQVAGKLTGRTVTFTRADAVASCEYTGTFAEGKSNRITGTATCSYTQNNVLHTFAGQWQADK